MSDVQVNNSSPITSARTSHLALLLLFFSATLWGLTWWPVKQFASAGLTGPWLTLLSYGPIGFAGLYFVWRERAAWRQQLVLFLLLGLFGGWANTAFINALLIGDVVRVMLLFYLSPVWSVLGGWLFLGEKLSVRRLFAVGLALAGLWFVIGGAEAFNAPLSTSDLLALSAGLAFAGNNLISRATQSVPMTSKTVVVFLGCGIWSAATVGWQHLPAPAMDESIGLALLAYGFFWMLLATATWQYGVTHLETGRAGVILITELVVAVLSVTWFGAEHMLPRIWLGGLLIAAASLIEATDNPAQSHQTSNNSTNHKELS
jgi:drug/metabolite transporter (DMT)-like permease